MKNQNRAVTSREYKLMLNTDRFFDRHAGAKHFYNLVEILIKKERGTITLLEEEKQREVSYFDTSELALRQNGFSVRLREEKSGSKPFRLNLKWRHADRYISASKDLKSTKKDDIKFEEDIIPPFNSKFSHSNTLKFETMPELKFMRNLTDFFPALKHLNIDEDYPIKPANELKVMEVAREFASIQFEESIKVEADLSFWYLTNDADFPIVGEFSFKYEAQNEPADDQLEDFSIVTAARADNFFRALQNQPGWLDFNNTTKTAFALDVL